MSKNVRIAVMGTRFPAGLSAKLAKTRLVLSKPIKSAIEGGMDDAAVAIILQGHLGHIVPSFSDRDELLDE